jgi:N-ethylmaleimide reductase
MTTLQSPLTLGPLTLPNRVLMAPLTRSRSGQPGDIPRSLNATYYAQRASAGLIISEATQISQQGKGYASTPGIHSAEQIAGWRRVTDAVHDAGGRIFNQLWHVGRISHTDLQPGGGAPVAPSAIRATSQTYTSAGSGFVRVSMPRALETDEIGGIVGQYRDAARNALEAGFDGVEIHGANGYLIDQFTRSGTNRRSDRYGGSLENRLRFPLEVAEAVAGVWGGERVGYRISPTGAFNDMSDDNPGGTFTALATGLGQLGLVYLHVAEAFAGSPRDEAVMGAIRGAFPGVYIANGGYTGESGEARLAQGKADAIAFGSLFIANPDLPERLRAGAPLNEPDQSTFYGGDARGYTDYPFVDESERVRAK